MRQPVMNTPQTHMRALHLTLTTTGATPAVSGPDKNQVSSVVDNGVGDVTIIFRKPFVIAPICIATAQGAAETSAQVKAKDVDRVTINIRTPSTELVAAALVDGVVDLYIAGKDDRFYR